ncbi:hypothetical protein C1H46_023698 [Malus baccata]|uniref:Helicase C-terminal domain-containing protein n=1 Tax=Malus baccata TaxID=106549 RepID=A0A540LWK6_MALBA|nr:hypothetical protein C1H46_023698 [Malus baccata]
MSKDRAKSGGWAAFDLKQRVRVPVAGEQGLNLVGADTVVIHDMDFNPQIVRQAEDHCHCIDQVKAVTIYRLVIKGTIDENVYEIAERK